MTAPLLVTYVLLAYFLAIAIAGLLLTLSAAARTRRERRLHEVMEEIRAGAQRRIPPLSIAVLSEGTELDVCATVHAMGSLTLPVEIIVMCDGTRSALLNMLVQQFDLHRVFRVYRHEVPGARIRAVYVSKSRPNLLVIDKEECGSADALNAALNVASCPLFAYVGGGCVLQPDALRRLIGEFVDAPPSLAVVAAPLRVLGSSLGDFIRFELALPPGPGWTALASAASAAGPFMVYRKRSLELIGGFGSRARPQGLDMALRLVEDLRRWGSHGHVRTISEPVGCENSTGALRRLRRHQAGLLEAISWYGRRLLSGGPASARKALLYLIAFELLTPLLELASCILLPAFLLYEWISGPLLATAFAVILGGPMLRAGFSALTECSDRRLYPDGGDVARRFLAILFSPLLFHPLTMWNRTFALLDGLNSMLQRRQSKYRPPIVRMSVIPAPPPPPAVSSPPSPPIAPSMTSAPPPPPLSWDGLWLASKAASAVVTGKSPGALLPMVHPARPSAPVEHPTSVRKRVVVAPPPVPPPLAPAPAAPAAPMPPVQPAPVVAARPPVPAPVRPPVPPPIPPMAPAPPAPLAVPKPAPAAAAGATSQASGQGGPMTFDVVTHYQIRADVPAGAMPAVQLPSGGAGPIILTTAQGAVAVPSSPTSPSAPAAPSAPGVTRAPEAGPSETPPPKPAGGHRAATIRRMKPKPAQPPAGSAAPPAPAAVPPAVEQRRRLPPIPDVPAKTSQPAPAVEQRRAAPPPTPRRELFEQIVGTGSPPPATPRAPKEHDTDVDMPAVDSGAGSEPLDLSEIEQRMAEAGETNVLDEPEEMPTAARDATSEPLDLGDTAVEPRERTNESSAEMPAVEQEITSEPLDLSELEDTTAREREPSADTSAVLPTVPEEVTSEPLDMGELEDTTAREREPSADTSAVLPTVQEEVSSEPLDMGDLEETAVRGDDKAEAAAAPESSGTAHGDTSAILPTVEGGESEPLDLSGLGDEDSGGTAIHLVPEEGESQHSGDTSAVLPAVPAELESEPLDLDTGSFTVLEPCEVERGFTLEPIEPGEIGRCLQSVAQSPIFTGVQAADRNRIVPYLKSATLPAERDVVREGEPGTGLFLIMSGGCSVLQHDEHGAERKLASLGVGDCFGEMSLLTGDPASATVRTVGDTRLLVISKDDFPRLTEALPWLGITLARLIAQRLARTSADVLQELKKGLFGRLELIPPSALVQAINVNSQSGLIVVQSGRQSFTGYFHDGQIMDAQTEEQEGEDAFYEFLSWSSGSFRFEPQRRENVVKIIQSDTVGLLLEGMRRIDETRAKKGDTRETRSVKLPGLAKPTGKRDAIKPMEPFTLADVDSAERALSRLSLFSGLRSDQIRAVIGVMQEVHALMGDCIIRQGQEGQALYIVSSGLFDVQHRDAEGREERVATLGPGDCFGEISLITGEAATATVMVVEEGTLLVIPREDLFHLLGRIPALGASLARILASRLAKASRWLREQEEVMGRLETMPLTELVQALNVNRQSGTLMVQNEGVTAELDFIEGEIQDVRLGDQRGDEPFFVLLGWNRGSFRFAPGRPETAVRTVKSDTMGLLFRGLRRLEGTWVKREHEPPQTRHIPMAAVPVAPPPAPEPGPPPPMAPGGVLETVELDLRDIKAVEESAREVGIIALEPLEPGDIRRGLEALAQSPVFYGVQAADRNRILPYLRSAYVDAGQDVLMEGKPGRGLFVVMSGSFDVLQRGEANQERKLATLGVGECFGEMSMLTGEATVASVRATAEGRLLVIAREDFPALVKALPWLGLALARLLAERLMRTSAELVSELNKGMVGRIELVSPTALVQAINVNAQTGQLTIESPKGTFVGYFEEGQLFEARAAGLDGADALYEAATWLAGTFRFEPQRRQGAVRRITIDTVGLMLEATRRLDESTLLGVIPNAASPVPRRETATRERHTRRLPRMEDERIAANALNRLALFAAVRPEQMEEVFSVLIEHETEPGDLIVRQGQLGQALYMVAAGQFDVVQRDPVGVQNKLATLRPGECFGELALITGAPAEATVACTAKGSLFLIPREEFVQLLGRIPEIGASLARILAARLGKASRWIQEQMKQGIYGRLESMPAMELVQALHVNGQSGTLVVQSENKTVQVVFSDGEVQDAKAEDVRGDDAFFKMLSWTAGAFRFEPGHPEAGRTVTSDTVGLMFRGLRRLERSRAKSAAEGRGDTADRKAKE